MNLYRIAVPLGIATFLLVLLAVLSGTRVIKVGFIWHRRFGLTAIVLAALHAGVILYFKYLA